MDFTRLRPESKVTFYIKELRRWTHVLMVFIRFPALGGTVILPILGAGTGLHAITPLQVFFLISIAIVFHIYSYVLNDIIDLPIDHSEPRRQGFPLVTGEFQTSFALVISFAQVPLAFLLAVWMNSSVLGYSALATAFVCITIYNLWGKRSIFPPLMDAIQGLGWAALVVLGATTSISYPNRLTLLTATYITIFIMMINGLHGSLRDLTNDYRCGVRSTAIFLGSRPQSVDGVFITPLLKRYAFSLQSILIGILLIALFWNPFYYNSWEWAITAAALLGMSLVCFRLLVTATHSTEKRMDMIAAGTLHLLISMASLLVLFAISLETWLQILLLVIYIAPMLTFVWFYHSINWLLSIIFHKKPAIAPRTRVSEK